MVTLVGHAWSVTWSSWKVMPQVLQDEFGRLCLEC